MQILLSDFVDYALYHKEIRTAQLPMFCPVSQGCGDGPKWARSTTSAGGSGHISGVGAGSIIQGLSLVLGCSFPLAPNLQEKVAASLAGQMPPRGCPPVLVLFTAEEWSAKWHCRRVPP